MIYNYYILYVYMELSDEYFRELINIDPTIGDFFLVNKKPDYQPNIYSSKYINYVY